MKSISINQGSISRLTYIQEGKNRRFFEAPERIESFDVSNNSITRLDVNSFHKFYNLVNLSINHNNIKRIDGFAFSTCYSLKRIELSGNWLGKLDDPNTFNFWNKYENKINYIDLSSNRLRRLNEKTFEQLNQLEYLDLTNNFLQSLDTDLFKFNLQLKKLYLRNNLFKKLPFTLLQGLKLKSLDLSGNRFNSINQVTLGNIDTEELYLNQIGTLKVIEEYAFFDMPKLKVLSIQNNNRLSYIYPKAFMRLSSNSSQIEYIGELNKVYFNGNNLKKLNSKVLPWNEINTIDLSNNYWDCSLDVCWMRKLKLNEKTVNDLKCYFPRKLKNVKIIELNDEKYSKCT